MRYIPQVIAAFLLAALLQAPPPPPVAAVVEQVVNAYGGRAALRAAGARVDRGSSTSVLHPGQRGAVRRVLGRGGDLRVEIRFPGADPEVRVVRRGRGVRNGVDVTGTPPHYAMVLQAARLHLPLLLLEGMARLEDLGLRERDGGTLRVLELPLGEGLLIQAGIDPASGRILRSAAAVSGALELEFATDYDDFRPVKGLLVPFHEVNYAQGTRTGETFLEAVEVQDAAPPGSFEGPGLEPKGLKL
jgi:hypothetical protein